MYCRECGTEIRDDAKFCKACGARQDIPKEEFEEEFEDDEFEEDEEYYYEEEVRAPKKPRLIERNEYGELKFNLRRSTLKKLIGAAAVLTILLIVITIFRKVTYKVDIMSYVELSCTGYNGHGTIDVEIPDVYKLTQELTETKNPSSTVLSTVQMLIYSGIDIEEGSNGQFSNGDTIKIKLTNLAQFQQSYPAKISNNASVERKVSGLTDVKTYNILEDVKVAFSGANTVGTAVLTLEQSKDAPIFLTISDEGEEGGAYLYHDDTYIGSLVVDNNGDLTNGDETVIKPDWYDSGVEELLDEYGVDVTATGETTVTVSGLSDIATMDLLSHAELSVTGVTGEGYPVYSWKSESWQEGNLTFTPSEENNRELYVTWTDAENGSEGSDTFYLTASPSGELSAGDVVTLQVEGYYEDDVVAANRFASQGVALSNTSMEYTVAAEDLGRYVTDASQLSRDSILALNDAISSIASEDVLNNWGSLVYNNSGYICYDQTITAAPSIYRAYLVCTDQSSNRYTLFIVMNMSVRDSEMAADQQLLVMYEYDMPVINDSGQLQEPENLERYDSWHSIDEMVSDFRYMNDETLVTYEMQ